MKIIEKFRPPRKQRNRVMSKIPGAGVRFTIRTRLGRATGVQGQRYPCDAVRVLPAKRDHVVLQATDGKQAVCLIAPGHADTSTLVPGSVLPTRQRSRDVEVHFDRGDWRSSEGKQAPPIETDQRFPPIAEVLPAMKGNGKRADVPGHITLGIDVSLLNRVADAFGTVNLTLFISSKNTAAKMGATYVSRAVAVCPADDEAGTHGVAVVMPLTPKHTADYYMKIRKDVLAAESRQTRQAQPKPQSAV